MSSQAFHLIDWDVVSNIMANSSIAFRTWISKHISGFCSTGRRMHLMKVWDSPFCPCCKSELEDTEHILKCHHPKMVHSFDKLIEDVNTWMEKNNTHPELFDAISRYVQNKGSQDFSF